ncbi:MAG: hypothetical protein ACR2KJ_18310 [Jatrophihabitans sp.]
MHVVVIVALVAALAAFVVGILTNSVPWVIASIALSAAALLLVVRSRPRGSDAADACVVQDSDEDAETGEDDEVDEVDEVDSEASEAATDKPEAETEDESVPEPAPDADEAWVIDGRPRYHLRSCSFLVGKDAEPVPLEQAIEDGFTPCSICDPPRTA